MRCLLCATGAASAALTGGDAAIDALVDALAELPEHELEGWQRGNRLGLRIVCELARRYQNPLAAPALTVRRKKPRVEAGLHESLRGSEPAAGKESWAAIAWLVIEHI
jgi:hypothetical protein